VRLAFRLPSMCVLFRRRIESSWECYLCTIQGRVRLSPRRAGRSRGSANSHCSSVNSQPPVIERLQKCLSTSSFAEVWPPNVDETGSNAPCLALRHASLNGKAQVSHGCAQLVSTRRLSIYHPKCKITFAVLSCIFTCAGTRNGSCRSP